MKFGLYSSIANPPQGEQLDRCIDEVIAEAQLAEASGFDSCFFGEHHQDHDGFLPSPLIVATAVAARTTRLRVGTSVILLPLHHPVHVAEDVITLDLVSKGRVILGVGIGYQPADFRAFSVPMEDRAGRFEESIEILRLCWAGEQFSFRGKLLHARGCPDPSAPLSEVGATAVDRRQHRRRRPPGRPDRRRLRRHAQHQPGERDASRRPI
jgi:alkanesulfonate monooxygenase SsuD/methylene tetrahydromethanopterin reductase-like flavin-dependent oxidoreductase (luciferase family)